MGRGGCFFSSPVGSLCHTPGIVRRVSSVVCGHHNYQKNKGGKPILSVNVCHVPGLCLLGIGGAPYNGYKIMTSIVGLHFHIFDLFS